MIFVKLIRVLAAVLAIWLICHLLYCLGKKNRMVRQNTQADAGHSNRKFVQSSVIEEKNEADDDQKEA